MIILQNWVWFNYAFSLSFSLPPISPFWFFISNIFPLFLQCWLIMASWQTTEALWRIEGHAFIRVTNQTYKVLTKERLVIYTFDFRGKAIIRISYNILYHQAHIILSSLTCSLLNYFVFIVFVEMFCWGCLCQCPCQKLNSDAKLKAPSHLPERDQLEPFSKMRAS